MENKRGQVTIFIIIAVIVVALVVLFYILSPRLGIDLTPEAKNPVKFIETCIEEDIEDAVEKLSLQGGSIAPEHFFLYNYNPVEYLCYTDEDYIPCIIQQPLLKPHIEREIKEEIEDNVDVCFNSLKDSFEEKGYEVNLKSGETSVELLPSRIITTFNYEVILTKAESEKYEKFEIVLNNNLYELISIGNSILEWEATSGDADCAIYMIYYHDLKCEWKLQSEGTKIYVLTNRDDGNKFQFATRAGVWPSGY